MPLVTIDEVTSVSSSAMQASESFNWRSAAATHIGRVRSVNEDALLESCGEALWCVSDGMGGLSRGDYASKTVIRALENFEQSDEAAESVSDLLDRLESANVACRKAFRGETLGATAAVLLVSGSYCYTVWAGDSRVYRLRNGELNQLSVDHTLKQAMLDGDLKFDTAEPSSHVLTRAVGIHRQLKLAMNMETVNRGDRYLLCSDGLYNPLEAETLSALLSHGDPSEAIDKLVQAALDNGGPDNITGIVVEAR